MAKGKQEVKAAPAVTPAGPPDQNQSQGKKKKKNDPLKPQPAWLFPPDEENPVLNPKVKSQAQIDKETEERLDAIDYLRHRSVSAPHKQAPPRLLLQLIGAFFTSYGFNNTGRIFTIERNARKKINGWNDELGKKFEKGTPSLVQIFQTWHREWELEKAESKKMKENNTSSSEDEEESSGDEASDVSSGEEKAAKKSAPVDSDSDDSSSSDSDGEDSGKAVKTIAKKAIIEAPKLKEKKRKDPSSESSSDSESASSGESDAPAKKQKIAKAAKQPNGVKAKTRKRAQEKPDSSDESDSSSESDSSTEAQTAVPNTTNGSAGSSDSSKTVNEDTRAPTDVEKGTGAAESSESEASGDSSSDSSSESEDEDPAPEETQQNPVSVSTPAAISKRKAMDSSPAIPVTASTKLAKKNNEPFSRIPKNTIVDPRLASNAYVPYDYAQKAHEDLIITRGKGFTKEKNKKKRGSYRGGMIDVGGGKGIKFTD